MAFFNPAGQTHHVQPQVQAKGLLREACERGKRQHQVLQPQAPAGNQTESSLNKLRCTKYTHNGQFISPFH